MIDKSSSIVPYGSYGLPFKPLAESTKYPDGLSGSFWQFVVGALVGVAANAFLGGGNNAGSGDKVTGISKDFVRMALGISEGQIEGIVDANGNAGGGIDYRPLQGIFIDKTPIQNNNPEKDFNFREENDDGSLKPNTAVDFKYVRGDVAENLAAVDDRNVIVLGLDANSIDVNYQGSTVTNTAEIRINREFVFGDVDPFRYGSEEITLSGIQVTSSGNLGLFVGDTVRVELISSVMIYSDWDRLDSNRTEATVTIAAISPSSVTISGLAPYGEIRILEQTIRLSKNSIIPSIPGVTRYITGIKSSGITALRVKISVIIQRIDRRGNALKDKLSFRISKQEQMFQGGAFGAEQVEVERTFDARYPTETFFDYLIPVNPEAYAYNILIRRLTPPQKQEDGGPQSKQLKLVSVAKLSSNRIAYLNTAIAYMQFPAKIIQNSPQIWIKVAGIKIEIPSNCTVTSDRGLDATGGWTGGFYVPSRACADPAWILWHLLTEPRYYTSIEPEYIDHFKLYEISRYNNQLVSDGAGGQERRHLFHGILGAGGQTNLFEMIRSVCASMNVKPYWNGSMLSFWQDKKEAVGALPRILGNADVENGQFSYTSQEFQSTTTVAKVTYQSIQDDWENGEEIVEDAKYISRYGYHTEEFTLLGETRRSAAVRAGRKIIADSLPTNVQVAMVVRPHALFFNPGDVIQIADTSRTKIRQSGLIRAVDVVGTTTRIYPDYFPFSLSPSGNSIIILLPDGSRIQRPFSSGGDHFAISGSLPSSPVPGATWLIVDTLIPVQKYRIISVEPEGEAQMMFKVVGTTYNEAKYAYIEDGLTFADVIPTPRLPAFMTPIDGGTVENPKTRLELIAIGSPLVQNTVLSQLGTNSSIDGSFIRSLQTSYSLLANWSPWEPPPDVQGNYLSHYIVEYRVNPDSDWTGRKVTKEPFARWDNLGYSPFYGARVAAVGINGKTSAFVQFGAINNDRMRETANIASRQISNMENTLYNTRDGVLPRTRVIENFVYGEVVLDINSPESIVIQVVLALLGRPATEQDLTGLITTALIGYDPELLWYQQRQVFYNVAAEIITDYGTEITNRYGGLSTQAILELIYNAAFNRGTDPIGLRDWTNHYEQALIPASPTIFNAIGALAVDIIFAASGNIDGITFRSKVSGLGLGVYKPIVIIQLFLALTGINPTVSNLQTYSNFSPFTYLAIANAIHGGNNTFIGDNNTQILTKIYQRCFDRNPDPIGLAFWSDRLSGGQTIPSLVVDIIFAASGNIDGDTFNAKVYKIFDQFSYQYRSGGMIHKIENVENDLYGKYDLLFENPERLRGLRRGEEGAIASLFGTTNSTEVDKNGVSRNVQKSVPPDTVFKIVGEETYTIGEVAVKYGGLLRSVYGLHQGESLGMRSGIMPTLFGLVPDSVYNFASADPSTGDVAIANGGVVNTIYNPSTGIFPVLFAGNTDNASKSIAKGGVVNTIYQEESGILDRLEKLELFESRLAFLEGLIGKQETGAIFTTFADKDHRHDDLYSLLGHRHDDLYSLLGHRHDNLYAAINHTHSQYALVDHSHPQYALASHGHGS